MSQQHPGLAHSLGRHGFIGGSDARIIMGQDEKALIRLWQEKRGQIGPADLSTNLIVQLGLVTEDLNRQWYERNTGNAVTDVQSRVKHPVIRWMAATLDGVVEQTGAVYEAKFMLPWSFSEEFAAEKYMAQLQHNMWVTNAKMAALSIITGGGKWVEISIAADQLYQHLLLTAEKKFWRCVRLVKPKAWMLFAIWRVCLPECVLALRELSLMSLIGSSCIFRSFCLISAILLSAIASARRFARRIRFVPELGWSVADP